MLENTERAIKNKRQPGETDNIDNEKQNKDKILLCIICQPRGQLRSYIHVHDVVAFGTDYIIFASLASD